MKDQVKAPVIVVAVIALVALVFFFGSKAMSVGDLDQGQAKYTPGVPPWQDKNRTAAPMDPRASNTAAPSPTPASAERAPSATTGSMPAGMTAPAIDNRGGN